MKKSKSVILIVLGAIFGALAVAGVYFLTVGEVAWQEYIETKLIPNAVIVISAIGSLCIAALPIINKVQSALDKFNKATSDISNTAENGNKTAESLTEYELKIDGIKKTFEEELKNIEDKFDVEIEKLFKMLGNTEKILRIGLCNIDELVKKGYAAEIGKVGKQDERSK